MNRSSKDEAFGVHPPLQMKSNHTADRNLMIERKNMRSPDRQKTHLQGL